MKHVVKHGLDADKARLVARKAFETYQERFAKYAPTATWVNDDHCTIGFTAKGISLAGSVSLKPGEIHIELDVPFLLKPFQGKAIDLIEGSIKEWIEKAKAGAI